MAVPRCADGPWLAPDVAQSAPAPPASSRDVKRRLARLALDESSLSTVRGGYDLGAGVTVNFAFQQATYVDHNLAQNVVIPNLTISPGQAGGLVASGNVMPPSISSATVVANGAVQSQVNVANSTLQALANSGMATIVGGSNGGVTTTLANTANNQLIQQMTTVDIGVTDCLKCCSRMLHRRCWAGLPDPMLSGELRRNECEKMAVARNCNRAGAPINRLIMAYLSSAPLTKLPDKNRKRLRCSRIAIVLRALTMAFGIVGLHSPCSAAGQSGAQHPSGLPEVLASVTVLSEAAMANETAARVQAAPIVRTRAVWLVYCCGMSCEYPNYHQAPTVPSH